MEMRIVADLTGDERLIKAFNKEYSSDFKKKYPDLRQTSKNINFGLVYGMGPGRLGMMIGVDAATAKGYMDKYFETFKNVKIWLDSASKLAVRNGYSMTPIGRKRWYLMPDKSDPN